VLRPYANDLVLIGGWVPYLQMKYGRASVSVVETSLTTEADLVVDSVLPRAGRSTIVELLEQVGFRPLGETGVVWARDPAFGETIEFFVAHRGQARSIGEPTAIHEQPGLHALSLDHLRIVGRFTEPSCCPARRRPSRRSRFACRAWAHT
jgi:hypothetical protein